MLLHCALQILSIALILHVFRTDGRFEAKGSHLGKLDFLLYRCQADIEDKSFVFGVISAVLSGITAALLTFSGMAARKYPPYSDSLTADV